MLATHVLHGRATTATASLGSRGTAGHSVGGGSLSTRSRGSSRLGGRGGGGGPVGTSLRHLQTAHGRHQSHMHGSSQGHRDRGARHSPISRQSPLLDMQNLELAASSDRPSREADADTDAASDFGAVGGATSSASSASASDAGRGPSGSASARHGSALGQHRHHRSHLPGARTPSNRSLPLPSGEAGASAGE